MMYGFGGYGAGLGGGLWMLGGLLLVAGIVVLAIWLLGPRLRLDGPGADPGPLDILRERYARGEISEEEFERRRKVLGA